MSALHQKDCYKIGHVHQYPKGTTEIYSNLTARSGNRSNIPGSEGVYFVGLQYFILDYLIEDWNYSFFFKPRDKVVAQYRRRVSHILGYDVDVSHIEALHRLGYLPIRIKALPEGTFVPYGVPMLTIRNTRPEFYWVTNMLESVMSSELWQPITSATTYMAYKKLFHRLADETGADKNFIPYQGHDFSFRGLPGRRAAAFSGFAVLAAGAIGTDNIPAIDLAEDYYEANAELEFIGQSVNATEHSVQCAGTKEHEFETYAYLMNEVYPEGVLSIVSDTWDFWRVVTEFLPRLKDSILNRNGKIVIRPDSGDPVDIICGTEYWGDTPEEKGLIECLWDIFGGTINSEGYRTLDPHIGAIYGDSITYERAECILAGLRDKGYSSDNIVLGIGSYTFQYVTRDTHGMAVKSTHAVINGESVPIFKEPKTDDGTKKSAKGYLKVESVDGRLVLKDQVSREEEEEGLLETVFCDGQLVRKEVLSEIRKRMAV